MRLRDYIIRRLLLLIPVLLGVSIIVFALTRMVGDPVAIYINEDKCDDACINNVTIKYGFDQPVPVQYIRYMQGLLTGDLGYSKTARLPVADAIAEKLPATCELATATMIISTIIGIRLGMTSAARRNRPADHAARFLALSGVSVPIFWLGLVLRFTFYFLTISVIGYSLLPVAGRFSTTPITMYGMKGSVDTWTHIYLLDSLLQRRWDGVTDAAKHLILPTLTLTFVTVAPILRMMRSSMLEVLGQEYIKTARSKGLTEKAVLWKHARRNALIPTTTVVGLSFGGLLGGAVLTESIFSWPGLGQWSAEATVTNDQAAIIGFTLVTAVVYVVANLVVDLFYAYLDPRIRLGE